MGALAGLAREGRSADRLQRTEGSVNPFRVDQTGVYAWRR